MLKSFIEYLFEEAIKNEKDQITGFLLPKYPVKGSSEVEEVKQCLVACLKKLKNNPKKFTISGNRGFNQPTVEKLLGHKIDTLRSAKVKKDVINYIISKPLAQSFNKGMKSTSHDKKYIGWVYIFIIKDVFENGFTVSDYSGYENRSGNYLYLKFNFISYKDVANNQIQIDLDSLVLDVISIHPTDSTK